MLSMRIVIMAVISALYAFSPAAGEYDDPHCDGRQVIVHLFEWTYESIANECEEVLGPMGYCAVQISPPNENAIIISQIAFRPWWERYQPVSYKLQTRSGNETQLRDMVRRCNSIGVRIYADIVANHMAAPGQKGFGTAGSDFDAAGRSFPAVPYTSEDFTPEELCPSVDGNINNYSNINEVKNCNLVGLSDLYGKSDYVRDMVAAYMNQLIEIGVAGFRMDAAKHMWIEDISAIQDRLRNLDTTQGFAPGSRPFFYHEVIDRSSTGVTVDQYYGLGRVTEFRFSNNIAAAVHDFSKLDSVYDTSAGMANDAQALVFVDDHDLQRYHWEDGEVITYKTPMRYKLAVAFTLAYPYGFARIMSSYDFKNDTNAGPPADQHQSTLPVTTNEDETCGNGWVCEHRWNVISKMVTFRNVVAGTALVHYIQKDDYVGFARGQKGYFAMSKSGFMNAVVQTGFHEGEYCNMIDNCRTKITVHRNGTAQIILNDLEDPVVALLSDDEYNF